MPFNKQKALDHIEFIQLLKLTGDFYGHPFVLTDWEHEVIWNVYGTVNDNGIRQYRTVYLEIPKKNGKTNLIAALGIDHLYNDPPGGEIYCCAAEREQAGIAYRAAKAMIEQDPELIRVLKVVDSKKEIHNRKTGTFMKVLSSEAYSKHGLNPSVIIFDELHAQPNRELWDTMSFGASSTRTQPLFYVITTAGDDPDKKSIGWEQHELAQKIISGDLEDPSWYVKIYAAPEDADIYDEAVWYECNPSLGVSIQIETVRSEAVAARNSDTAEKLFRWLRLNQWVSLKRTGWLPLTLWDQTAGDWSIGDLTGRYCYAGLDLSSTTDLTAIALLFPPQEGQDDWRAIFKTFIPLENMKERVRRDKVPYEKWIKEKSLIATDGNAVDYEVVQTHIEELATLYKIKYLCADPWNSAQMTQNLAKKGIQTVEIKQTIAEMSPSMKNIEVLMRTGKFTHEVNGLVRWAFGNVVVFTDGNANVKPMKDRSIEKIDPIVALVDAMNAAIKLEQKTSSYEDHGIMMMG